MISDIRIMQKHKQFLHYHVNIHVDTIQGPYSKTSQGDLLRQHIPPMVVKAEKIDFRCFV